MTIRHSIKRKALAGASIGMFCATLWTAATPASASPDVPAPAAASSDGGVDRHKPCNDQEAGTIYIGHGWTYRCSKDGRVVLAQLLNW